MKGYRSNPPSVINSSRVIRINDYEKLVSTDLVQSDVLQFFLEDGSKISVRPSGTEPKIKFYFSVNTKLASAGKYEETLKLLNKRIEDIIKDMKLV
jgi:phosphoglucomutase